MRRLGTGARFVTGGSGKGVFFLRFELVWRLGLCEARYDLERGGEGGRERRVTFFGGGSKLGRQGKEGKGRDIMFPLPACVSGK